MAEGTAAQSTMNPAPIAKPASAQVLRFAGFGCCVTWLLLQETSLSLNEVNLFNYCLYGCIGQLTACTALAVAGAKVDFKPSSALMRVMGVAGAAGIALQFSSAPVVCVVGALATGAATGTLLIAWSIRLAELEARHAFIQVLAAMLAGILVSFCCFSARHTLPNIDVVLGVALPLGAAFLPWRNDRPSLCAAGHHERLPWPFLLMLGASCLLSSFFQGVATNPYAFQSDSVAFFRLAYAAGAFALLLLVALATKSPKAQVFFLAVLAMLLIGLFLFSAGILDSIILPLGLILAARTCCFALTLITLIMLAKASGFAPALVLGAGLAVCDGTLGKAAGLLVSGQLQPSFPDLALGASICIVAFTLLYAVMVALHPDANNTLNIDLEKPVAVFPEIDRRTALERHLDQLGLTSKETEAAHLILEGGTYAEIAEKMGIEQRTVKFHASNVFKKAQVKNRREFAKLMLGDSADDRDGA